MRRLWLLALVPLLAAGCSFSRDELVPPGEGFDTAHSTFTPETLRSFDEFPLYWLGEKFEQWELVTILGPYPGSRQIYLVYGRCRLSGGDEPRCSPPVSIQIQPLCDHLDAVAHHGAWKKFRIRGAPLGGRPHVRVLFTDRVQIKVVANSGADPDRGERVFEALRSANAVGPQVGPGDPLPPASLAVLGGEAPCTVPAR